MLLVESDLSSDGETGDPVRLVGYFNIEIIPSSDWVGELRLQYSFEDDQSRWADEYNETDFNWGDVVGRVVGLETEREGLWYRAAIPTGGYTSGSVRVRFSK